jgi:exonuclease III
VYGNFILNLGSFNLLGQGNKNLVKLRKLCYLFTKGNVDNFLLQETRTDGSEKELKKWQKLFHSKQIFLTNFGTRSVGAGIIIKNEESFKVHQCFNDPEGRYVGVVGDHEEGKFLILSFYSPSVENEIKSFVIDSICAKLTAMNTDLPQFLVLGGDTNTVFSNLDKEGGNQNFKNHAINAFETMKQNFNLFDTFRLKNPTKRLYTWETLNPSIIRERIDMIFVSNSLQDFITESGTVPVHLTCSDHGIPYVRIQGFGIPSRGPGLWKFNNQLLSDPLYVTELKEQLPKWTAESEEDLPNDSGTQWGYIKHKIGEFSRDYGAKIKKAKLLIKLQIENELKQLQNDLNDTNKQRYANLQDQLNDIIENEVKGSILRSLCNDYKAGEKCSKYFFSLEKYRNKQKTISRIKMASGSFTSDPKLVLEECRLFYKKLYSANPQVDPNTFPFFYQNPTIPKLTEDQRLLCDAELTEDELFKTLKAFQKNKSPGLDGITAEFYITFWREINVFSL